MFNWCFIIADWSRYIYREIETVKINHMKYNLRLQPFNVVVGPAEVIEKIFVIANNIKLICDSFIKAADMLFKIHMVLDIGTLQHRMPAGMGVHPSFYV